MTIYYSVSTKGFYDSDIGYVSYPDDIVEITKEEHQQYLTAINMQGKELYLDGNQKLALRPKTIVVTWEEVRARRNKLLDQCDYTQMPDYPGDKTAWAAYRQALRDIPTTFTDPASVTWPSRPGD